MTQQRDSLGQLQALIDAATEGKWMARKDPQWDEEATGETLYEVLDGSGREAELVADLMTEGNATFIATIRSLAQPLLDVVKAAAEQQKWSEAYMSKHLSAALAALEQRIAEVVK